MRRIGKSLFAITVDIRSVLSLLLVAYVSVFSVLPVQRQYFVYEPIFQQHYDEDDYTVSFAVINQCHEASELKVSPIADRSKISAVISLSNRRFQSSFISEFFSSFFTNSYYTFVSINAP